MKQLRKSCQVCGNVGFGFCMAIEWHWWAALWFCVAFLPDFLFPEKQ